MLTKQDLKEEMGLVRKEFKTEIEGARQEFKTEIEGAVAQISKAIDKALEGKADKADLVNLATKDDLKRVEERLGKVETELSYVKSDVRDLKADSPTAREFQNHEVRIRKLETFHASA